MYNFCTLFDINYLSRGIAMYESLKKFNSNFNLFIFAFDLKSYEILQSLNLEMVTVISLNEFEDKELLDVKNKRTSVEYCWTCTPSIIKYCIEKFNLNNCTYLDADLYFFSDPSILIEEMEDKSILITKHRYTPEYDQSSVSGIYCVLFVSFINNINGMNALNWWREKCIDWCYAKPEDNKFGDQKYLDDWTSRFQGVHELKNLGGGVAPWNIQQYNLEEKNFDLIFYHFHGLKLLTNDRFLLSEYKLRKSDIRLLYIPYIIHLDKINKFLVNLDKTLDSLLFKKKKLSLKSLYKNFNNIYKKKNLFSI